MRNGACLQEGVGVRGEAHSVTKCSQFHPTFNLISASYIRLHIHRFPEPSVLTSLRIHHVV